jgi:hypothetical protein
LTRCKSLCEKIFLEKSDREPKRGGQSSRRIKFGGAGAWHGRRNQASSAPYYSGNIVAGGVGSRENQEMNDAAHQSPVPWFFDFPDHLQLEGLTVVQ